MNIPELLKTVEETPQGIDILIGSTPDEYKESLQAIWDNFPVLAFTHTIVGNNHYITK